MKKASPKFICDEQGKKTKVVISVHVFEQVLEALEDLCDYQLVKNREKKSERIYSLEVVRKKLGIKS